MAARIKYRLTPFHLVSLWFFYKMVIEFGINAKLGNKAELGVLFPFVYLGLFLVTLLLDFVIQYIVSASIKGDWKMLYLIQILIVLFIVVLMNPTVHYAD